MCTFSIHVASFLHKGSQAATICHRDVLKILALWSWRTSPTCSLDAA